MPIILPIAYLPPLAWWSLLLGQQEVLLELHENYPRQTYRNRCHIYSSNGLLPLIIPVIKTTGNHTRIGDMLIDKSKNWQVVHWRSIESAYRKTPYFQFYADELRSFYSLKTDRLVDFNLALINFCLKCLRLSDIKLIGTSSYDRLESQFDYRDLIHPKKSTELFNYSEYPRYIQAFEHLHGFIPNLSILDLLANEGPGALQFLHGIFRLNTMNGPENQMGIQS